MTPSEVLRIFVTLLAAVVQLSESQIEGKPPVELNSLLDNGNDFYWIQQNLDHFNPFDNRKWQMRYIARGEYFVNGGPLFIFVGGENEIESSSLRSGHFHDMARDNNAFVFVTEHRFYGKSQPFGDLSTANLKFLTSQQALADLRHFVLTMKSIIRGCAHSKVVVAGGSYSGTLAMWFRRIYPDLVHAVWASSAPILAKSSFPEYTVIGGNIIRKLGGAVCYNRIKNGINRLEQMFTSPDQALHAKSLLNLCPNFDVKNIFDLGSLFRTIQSAFTLGDIDQVSRNCDFIRQFADDLIAIAKFFTHSMNSSGCLAVNFRDTSAIYADTSLSSVNHDCRAWFYQVCNEFGWFATSDSPNQPFGKMFPSQICTAGCEAIFGPMFTRHQIDYNMIKTNSYYGGLGPIQSRVFATVGEFDPYSGATYRAVDGATIIPKATHCEDLNSISSTDSSEMIEAKKTISRLVAEWIR